MSDFHEIFCTCYRPNVAAAWSSSDDNAERYVGMPPVLCRGATTAEKLRGPRFGSQHRAPGHRPGWGGCGRGLSLPLWWSRSTTPGKFLKNQMLTPAFR